jgi:catechol-2,3-dioxygenase
VLATAFKFSAGNGQTIQQEEWMIKPKCIDHVLINVTDLNRAVKFYTENFGFKTSGQYEGAVVWMNFGQYEEKGLYIHDFGLYKVEQDLPE